MQKTEAVLAQYARELASVRGAAPNTVRAYAGAVKRYSRWLGDRGDDIFRAGRDDIITYRESLSGRAAESVAMAVKSLRSFYAFALDAGFVQGSPVPATMRVKVKTQEPRDVPTVAQFLGLRAGMTDAPLAHRALVEFLAGSGLRISTVVTTRVRNLRLGDKPCLVVDAATMACKGSHAGLVPLAPHAARLLAELVAARRLNPDDLLFALSEGAARRVLARSVPPALAGLSPHSFRHFYCAATYYRNFDGGRFDVVWVRDAAGHSNIAITNNYLRLARTICVSDAEWENWAYGQYPAQHAA